MIIPTIVYALVYTFCLYDNFGSIMTPVFAISTVVYVRYILKRMNVTYKKDSWFYESAIVLLGIAPAITGNGIIIFWDHVGILVLLLCLLFHNFYDDSRWTISKYFTSSLRAVFGAVGCIGAPFMDLYHSQKVGKHKNIKRTIQIGLGIVVALPFVVLVTTLLYYSDAIFANMIHINWHWELDMDTIFGISFTFAFGFFSAYCGMKYLEKRKIIGACKERKNAEPLIAQIVLGMTSVVYLFYCGIQILALFLRQMSLPTGYTYARYAREGFFQLAFVCVLNVMLILMVNAWCRENKILKVLQLVICGCTYIMIASSAYRMILYIRNYELTFLRVFVLWALAVMVILLAGIIYQISHKEFVICRYMIVVFSVAWIGFSFSRPDYYIARYNVSHNMRDPEYLTWLSSDAAGVIAEQSGDWVEEYKEYVVENDGNNLRKYNISRAYAQKLCDNK